jgi:hypothetical protein
MLNQKGQAFSVFQLLIAAIVAVAILGVLFSVMGGINVGVTGDPKTAIGNALASVKNGGQVTTQSFSMNEGDTVTGIDFEDKGFEAASIVFVPGVFEDQSFFTVNNDEETDSDELYGYIRYTGKTARTLRASVYCQATGDRLGSVLGIAEIDYDSKLCLEDEDIQPCCAVVLIRDK